MMFVRGLSQLIRSTFHPLEEQIRRECVAGNISEAMFKFRKLLDSDVMPSQECLGYLLHYSRTAEKRDYLDEVLSVAARVVNPEHYFVSKQIKCLVVAGRLHEAWELYQQSVHRNATIRIGVILTLLNNVVERQDICKVLQLLSDFKMKSHSLPPIIAEKVLQTATLMGGSKWRKAVWEVMNIYRNCEDPLTDDVSGKLVNWFKSDWGDCHAKNTTIVRGHCSECGHRLERNSISKDEHSSLLKHAQEHLDNEANSFETCDKEVQEVNTFRRFITRQGPFGAVVDGMNVTMARPSRNTEKLISASKQISYYSKLPVLVIARIHLAKRFTLDGLINKPSVMQIQNHYSQSNIHIFFTTNRIAEDKFIIAGSLATKSQFLVTNDLFGDYQQNIPSAQLRKAFKKWQTAHQVFFITRKKKEVILKLPRRYNSAIQWTDNDTIHVPLDNGRWLCITKINC